MWSPVLAGSGLLAGNIIVWIVFTPVCLYLFLLLVQPVKRWQYRKYPGPFGWPLVGNAITMFNKGGHEYMLECRQKYGPVYKIWLGMTPWVVVADAETTRRIFNKLNDRVTGRGFMRSEENRIMAEHGLVAANGLVWKRVRNAWQPFFQQANLSALTELMNRCADTLVERLDTSAGQGEVVDIWRQLGDMTMAVVGTTAFGVDFHTLAATSGEEAERGKKLVENARRMFSVGGFRGVSGYGIVALLVPSLHPVMQFLANRFPDANLRKTRAAFDGLKETALDIVQQQLKQTSSDDKQTKAALSGERNSLPSAQDGAEDNYVGDFVPLVAKRLQNVWEIIGQSNTFILAGYETTANTLALAVYNISRSPEVERLLLEEVDAYPRDATLGYAELQRFPYATAVLKETLRLHGPVPFMNRIARHGCQVNGHVMPPGAIVTIAFWVLHHDPQYWPEPWEFRPDRFLPGGQAEKVHPGAYAPFGGGARVCIGEKFAMMEAKVALIKLYQRFLFRLEGGTDAYPPIKFTQGITLSPAGGVRVKPIRRG